MEKKTNIILRLKHIFIKNILFAVCGIVVIIITVTSIMLLVPSKKEEKIFFENKIIKSTVVKNENKNSLADNKESVTRQTQASTPLEEDIITVIEDDITVNSSDDNEIDPSHLLHKNFLEENQEEIELFETEVIEETEAAKVRVDGKGHVAFMNSPEGFNRGVQEVAEDIAMRYFEIFQDAETVRLSLIIGGGVRSAHTFYRKEIYH